MMATRDGRWRRRRRMATDRPTPQRTNAVTEFRTVAMVIDVDGQQPSKQLLTDNYVKHQMTSTRAVSFNWTLQTRWSFSFCFQKSKNKLNWTNLGWCGWVETEKFLTAVTAAAICLPLTSKLSDHAGLVVWVEMILSPFFTLALSKQRNRIVKKKTGALCPCVAVAVSVGSSVSHGETGEATGVILSQGPCGDSFFIFSLSPPKNL